MTGEQAGGTPRCNDNAGCDLEARTQQEPSVDEEGCKVLTRSRDAVMMGGKGHIQKTGTLRHQVDMTGNKEGKE